MVLWSYPKPHGRWWPRPGPSTPPSHIPAYLWEPLGGLNHLVVPLLVSLTPCQPS